MKKFFNSLVLLGALTFALSCKKGPEVEKPLAELAIVDQDTLPEIKAYLASQYGAKLAEVRFDKKGDRFIVQGDIAVDKASAEFQYKERLKIPKLSSDKVSHPGISQRRSEVQYDVAYAPVIRVKLNISNPDWKAAAQAAIKNYSHSLANTISNVRMVEVTSGTVHCTITETGLYDPSNNNAVGENPKFSGFNRIPGTYVNIYTNGNGISQAEKILVITHELGHVIGFKHTGDTGAGTYPIGTLPADDIYSYMRPGGAQWAARFDGFSNLDLQALSIMYPRTIPGWGLKNGITGINIAAGNNSFVYLTSNTVTSDGNRIFFQWNFNNNSWLLSPPVRKGVKMAIAGNGQYYFITADKKIYKNAYPDPILMPGEAIDIAANDVGELFIVSNTVIDAEGNQIMKWDGASWNNYSTHPAKAIAIGPGYDPKPVIINNSGTVNFFFTNVGVSPATGVQATSVAVCNSKLDVTGNLIVYVTDKTGVSGTADYPIKVWTGRDWYTTNKSGAALAVDHNGHPWTVTAATGEVYAHPEF